MKTTIVPAQVTTVEDRIMGNLGFSQLLLLLVPIFVAAGLYALLPPFMNGSLLKYVVGVIVLVGCCALAIRIKGKILAYWLVIILRYTLRPRYYLFDKNSAFLRETYQARSVKDEQKVVTAHDGKQKVRRRLPQLEIHETASMMSRLSDPSSKLRFETTKTGGLYVRLTEIEE